MTLRSATTCTALQRSNTKRDAHEPPDFPGRGPQAVLVLAYAARVDGRAVSWRRRAIAVLFLVVAGLGAWAFWFEPASLRVRDATLELPRWPGACAGLRVALLSDLHVGSPFNGTDKLKRIVAETNAAAPDLVLLAGDYVIQGVPLGTPVASEVIAAELGKLSAPMGVFAVLGNHDHWDDAPRIQREFEGHGIPVLEDRSLSVKRGDCELWIAGVSDWSTAPHDLRAALSGIPDGATILVLTHHPDLFPRVPARVALTVAGHTHGGQVRLPWLGRLVVPSAYGDRYAIGHVEENGRHLFVTPGLGTSILPVRFLVPPEISMLHLQPATP